ncbi:MAG: hypothetical protein ACE5Z5_01730 [Candidatus Bathyarchaeia archaeon]
MSPASRESSAEGSASLFAVRLGVSGVGTHGVHRYQSEAHRSLGIFNKEKR